MKKDYSKETVMLFVNSWSIDYIQNECEPNELFFELYKMRKALENERDDNAWLRRQFESIQKLLEMELNRPITINVGRNENE